MKDKLVPILIFLGVIFATSRFQEKVSSIYGLIDNVREGMADVIHNAPRDANFSFQCIGDSTKSQVISAYMRYLLAPRHVSNHVSEYDTVLTICDARFYERTKHKIEDQRMLLMKLNNNQYYFLETCSK